ncbi:MAG TPA: tetratricopeptide repeat protein [Roseiflexaceae bacterium]
MNLHPNFDTLALDKQARLVQAAWRDPAPRLLVFDNCEDEALLAAWRPPAGGCRVLVTSRRARWSAALVTWVLPLHVLDRAESIALLRGHCANLPGADQLFADPAAGASLDAIAGDLGDLPLALNLAGAYLAHRYLDLDPARYLSACQRIISNRQDTKDAKILIHFASLALLATWRFRKTGSCFLTSPKPAARRRAGRSPGAHAAALVAAGRRSGAILRRPGPRAGLRAELPAPASHQPDDALALKLLARAARCAPGEPLPRELLLATVALTESRADLQTEAEDALARLAGDLSLLELGAGGMLRMHRLIAGFVRATAGDAAAQAAVERAVFDVAARPFYERALAIWERTMGPDHDETGSAHNNLGYLLFQLGDLTAAQKHLRPALTIATASPGCATLGRRAY